MAAPLRKGQRRADGEAGVTAAGQTGTYPVAVTLSAAKTSAQGPWFSRLTVTWQGNRPPGATPDSFALMPPRES
ncbi:MAG: hypothetical protein JO345_00290 [Streptosporangiaceae bacterium]|nr:hypothetical protein [Streptosporangiaceae bacterium]